MSVNGWLQFSIYCLVLLLTVKPVGIYLARVFEGQRTWLDPLLRPCERLIYKFVGVKGEQAMNWRAYTRGPTMSYPTQMAGLATHNFFSAATGIVVAGALIRGIKRTSSGTIGNFWVDTTRTLLYVLLPGSIIYGLLLVSQGVPQNLHAYTTAHLLEDSAKTQTIAQGPVASQEAIKMLGTNGGGFFNANSAHPFENPTPFSNFLQMLSIFLIPAGLTYTLGRMTGSPGHGWAVLAAMFVLFAAGFTTVYWAESHPHLLIHGAAQAGSASAPAGNMEGKEVRFGVSQSALFATI